MSIFGKGFSPRSIFQPGAKKVEPLYIDPAVSSSPGGGGLTIGDKTAQLYRVKVDAGGSVKGELNGITDVTFTWSVPENGRYRCGVSEPIVGDGFYCFPQIQESLTVSYAVIFLDDRTFDIIVFDTALQVLQGLSDNLQVAIEYWS